MGQWSWALTKFMSLLYYRRCSVSDNSKPAATRGRKAMGPHEGSPVAEENADFSAGPVRCSPGRFDYLRDGG